MTMNPSMNMAMKNFFGHKKQIFPRGGADKEIYLPGLPQI